MLHRNWPGVRINWLPVGHVSGILMESAGFVHAIRLAFERFSHSSNADAHESELKAALEREVYGLDPILSNETETWMKVPFTLKPKSYSGNKKQTIVSKVADAMKM